MRNLKKLTAVSLILVMMAAALSGCGSSKSTNKTNNNTGNDAQATQAADNSGNSDGVTPATSYKMFMRSQYADWIKELKWYDVAEEKTGIHVEYVEGPEEIADTYTEVDERIASGTLPDAAMVNLAQAKVYGEQGAFVDLAPYIKKYAPNLQAYIDKNPDYKSYVSSDNGAIYGLVKESPIFADLIGYRADQFKEAGIDPASVKTVDDFTAAMETLKKFYGAKDKNYYPLSGRDSALRFAAWFGAASYADANGSGGVYYNHEKDGSFNIKADGAYTWIETMKKWYDEGLINPLWVAGTNSEGDWESQTLEGQASIFYDYYNRAEWFMQNVGADGNKNYDMQVLNFLQDASGKTIPVTSSILYQNGCVTAVNSARNESTIAAILKFIDYFYSEEGITLANWGVEGESFTTNDSTKMFIADYTTEESKAAGEKRWSFLSDRFTVCKPVDQTAFYSWNTKLIADAANSNFKTENFLDRPTLIYSTSQEEELTNLVASVFEGESAGLTAFITGSKELNKDNWNAFIKEMDNMGLSQIEKIQAEAYTNTFSK
ncbi:type 2 periplasmic-binding domain-containing protein [Anaerocolumna chitinilytica]|uniref:Extracellular solute-binding protein n=1 Tax=Anaerocolumna chitinilytica TaxID=1727145 RepID=A0A7I8DHA2_9FIRM|nr:hypothetical protein [Anaerocolumna chitinilytica]BCJ97067.1 hypothetical protein bsdcttw_01080 [Anaerocolumna chitinilytica]